MATQLFSRTLFFCLLGLLLYGLYYYLIPHQKVMFGMKSVMNTDFSTNGSFLADPIQMDSRMARFKVKPPSYASYKTNCSCVCLKKSIIEMNCIKNANITSNRTIYIKTRARLGNVLFQISSAYAIAKDTNSQLAVVGNSLLNTLESRPFKTITSKQWAKSKAKFVNGLHKLIDFERAFNTSLTSSVKLSHFLQRFIYFARCENEIRQKLALKSSAIKNADSAISNLIKNHKNLTSENLKSVTETISNSDFNSTDFVTVGIHIRRGDLTISSKYKYGYRPPSISYFTNAMNYFTSKYSKVVFIIATDGKSWVKQHLLKPGVYLSPLKSPVEDMALISRCDHAIISIGTFSWWAGFYNRGTVIYFKNWIAPNSRIWKRIEYSEKERFPPYWIPML